LSSASRISWRCGTTSPHRPDFRRNHPLLAGRPDVDGTTEIVGRGTGTWGPRMRLWRPAEILRLVLRTCHYASAVSHP